MKVPEEVSRAVRSRARMRCQYCLMHSSLQGATFHIEHIIPVYKGGQTNLENLILACPGCNLRKSTRTTAIDPVSGQTVPLYHPVIQKWTEHFRFNGYEMQGLTATGRATIEVLDLNHSRRMRIREAEEVFGLFPPFD